MAVSLILIATLLQIFNAATTTWQRGEAQSDAYREARGALQLMARDLSATLQASYAQPAQVPFGTAVSATPLIPTLVLNRYSVFDTTQTADPNQQNNEEVYCLTVTSSPAAVSTVSPSPSPSALASARELCAVGYFCQWLPSVAPYNVNAASAARAPHAYGLMRQYLNGDGTFQRFRKAQQTSPGTTLGFLDIYKRGAVSLNPAPSIPLDTDGTTPLAQSVELAAYVWDLKVRISTNLVTTPVTTGQNYDNGESTPITATDPATNSSYDYSATRQSLPPDLPPYVEIRFKALSANAGRRLEGNTNVTPSDWLPSATTSIHQSLIVPNARQFVLRVPMTNGSAQVPTPTPTPSP